MSTTSCYIDISHSLRSVALKIGPRKAKHACDNGQINVDKTLSENQHCDCQQVHCIATNNILYFPL